jgi:hypothetical protein
MRCRPIGLSSADEEVEIDRGFTIRLPVTAAFSTIRSAAITLPGELVCTANLYQGRRFTLSQDSEEPTHV